jgi:hypothetical protein
LITLIITFLLSFIPYYKSDYNFFARSWVRVYTSDISVKHNQGNSSITQLCDAILVTRFPQGVPLANLQVIGDDCQGKIIQVNIIATILNLFVIYITLVGLDIIRRGLIRRTVL